MPIENVFINKYMKEATSKYKFFKIVINEATTNVKSLLKDIWSKETKRVIWVQKIENQENKSNKKYTKDKSQINNLSQAWVANDTVDPT